MSEDICGTPES